MSVPIAVVIIIKDTTATELVANPENYAKVTAIRIQDIAKQIWYSWDDPPRAWNKLPEVTPSADNLYVAFWATNQQSEPVEITLNIIRASDSSILQTKTWGVPSGTGLGIEWTGRATLINTRLILEAVYTVPVVIPEPEPTPTPPPTPPIVLPMIELPALPWYLSWLGPLIQYIAAFGAAVVNYLPNIFPIQKAIDAIVNIPKSIWDGLTGNIGKTIEEVSIVSLKKATQISRDVKAGSPDVVSELEKELGGDWGAVVTGLSGDIGAIDPGSGVLSGGEAVEWMNKYAAKVRAAGASTFLMRAITETASLGQFEFASEVEPLLVAKLGVNEVSIKAHMWPIQKGVLQPAEYQMNAWLPTLKPSLDEMMQMASKGLCEYNFFKSELLQHGFNSFWAEKLWDVTKQYPSLGDLVKAYFREGWTDEQLRTYVEKLQISVSDFDVVWDKIKDTIPPYPDIINMRVKEVISQADFRKFLYKQGYKTEWADKLWDAHFAPAGWMDFLTAMRRKETVSIPHAEGATTTHTFGTDLTKDIDVLKELSILVDYDNRYWDFFKTRMYNDPTPRMSMWSYEVGAIKEPQLREVVHRYGYTPDTEQWFGDMLIHFQERPWVTRYITALMTAYIGETINDDELKKRILAIPRNENVADWIIKIADVRKEITASKGGVEQVKLLTVGELKEMRFRNIIDDERFRSEMLRRGYDLGDIELYIELITEQYNELVEGGAKKGLTVAELFDTFRYGFKTEDELRTTLLLRGMALDDVNVLIEVKKKKWEIGGQVSGGD